MKYTPETVKKLCDALETGQGRVYAVESVGIAYRTFLDWLEDPRKPQFSQLIKKAEESGNNRNKEKCKQRILIDKSWQSAAWWLERNHPDEFKNRTEVKQETDTPVQIVVTNDIKPLNESVTE